MQFHKIAVLAAALGLAGAASSQASGFRKPASAPAAPVVASKVGTQWITLTNGCSYSRTQAPGYAPMWILIQNPHHIGQPNVHKGCQRYLTNIGG
ncbi:hypothetical protein ACRARG_09630 [Pseudooceanicola sp. C21-150M6]|uniref:hypothetical protein n=1 Tax=Pseudooceanicola sp. C21-150M6 TaxID=3434355 RepID=UPI003D7F3F93